MTLMNETTTTRPTILDTLAYRHETEPACWPKEPSEYRLSDFVIRRERAWRHGAAWDYNVYLRLDLGGYIVHHGWTKAEANAALAGIPA